MMDGKIVVCAKLSGKMEAKTFLNLNLNKYLYSPHRSGLNILKRRYIAPLLPRSWKRMIPHMTYAPAWGGKCRLLHTVNTLNLGSSPWIVTHESRLPRWGYLTNWHNVPGMQFGLKLLQGDRCKAILSMSQCAYDIQANFMSEYPRYGAQIVSKMQVLHPAQEPLISSYADKSLPEDDIVFTFVGGDYFRKGGLALIRAFSRLIEAGAPIRLNIVSSLSIHSSGANSDDIAHVRHLIGRYPERIFQVDKLSNGEVLRLFRDSHIGILPSLDDTYGFSVLEAQANGCPVITTNARAFPEINSNESGWIIDIPLDEEFYSADGFTSWIDGIRGSCDHVERIIEDRIVEIVNHIASDPGQIEKKGILALKRIRDHHDPTTLARRLESIYDKALAD